MSKKVAVFLADGFEEIEGLTVVDLLRRADIMVDTISITGKNVICGAHDICVTADMQIDRVTIEQYDMLVLPGGMPGTIHLEENPLVRDAVKHFNKEGKWLAAICAAPTMFGNLGILIERCATCYPSMQNALLCGEYSEENVVVSDHIITSRGMGTAIDFSLKLIEVLLDKETATHIGKSIVYL